MSIFNGDSIYKSGGGGGFSDGGELVDGDFIKVENNTISTYDNTARSDINFYFDGGQTINSVVELTTLVNSTVHVYILQNGLFIPLGNVGGDTVNAGQEYNINIIGNSFMLELVTPGSTDPEAIIYEGEIYQLKKYGSVSWVVGFLKAALTGSRKVNGIYYYPRSVIRSFHDDHLSVPSKSDWSDLRANYGLTNNDLKDTTGWANNGNNSSGLAFRPSGILVNSTSNIDTPGNCYFGLSDTTEFATIIGYMNNGGGMGDSTLASEDYYVPLRLVIKN